MSINKFQGQSLKVVGLHLDKLLLTWTASCRLLSLQRVSFHPSMVNRSKEKNDCGEWGAEQCVMNWLSARTIVCPETKEILVRIVSVYIFWCFKKRICNWSN